MIVSCSFVGTVRAHMRARAGIYRRERERGVTMGAHIEVDCEQRMRLRESAVM